MGRAVTSLLPAFLGFALGMRHALEPDHLAAVSTLATAEHGGARSSMQLGAWWGLGHTLALLVVGGSLAMLGAQMPPLLERGFELAVAAMVVTLGVRAVMRAVREGREGAVHTHAHGAVEHRHAAPAAHVHLSRWTLATRPLLIGVMHGLAGSGALTALVLADLPGFASRLAYIALFGAGSIAGMAALTGLAGAPLRRAAHSPRVAAALLLAAGVTSTVVGLWWGAAVVRSF